MPHFEHFPFPCRYNSLRLLGYDYNSPLRLCAITLVAQARRPVFAEMKLAKGVVSSLLSDATLSEMHLRGFTLMPDHLHLVAGVRQRESDLRTLIGQFKSFSTQLYWKRSREIVAGEDLSVPSLFVNKSNDSQVLLSALSGWQVTLRPEVVQLRNWPSPAPGLFLSKHLWQQQFFDHVIRNEKDLHENLHYIAYNSMRAGYVTQPHFYPYTGFLID